MRLIASELIASELIANDRAPNINSSLWLNIRSIGIISWIYIKRFTNLIIKILTTKKRPQIKNIKMATPLKIQICILANKDTALKWGFGNAIIKIIYSC